jgi:hypothetical protein
MQTSEVLGTGFLIAATDEGITLVENAGRRGPRAARTDWPGGRPVALLETGGRVFAAAEDGIWRARPCRAGVPTPAVHEWERAPGAPARRMCCLAAAGTVIYAGRDDGTLLVSRDSGETWSQSDALIKAQQSGPATVAALGVDAKRPYAVVAALESGAILLSTDFGETWNTAGSVPAPVLSVGLSYYQREEIVYAATGSGFHRSRAVDVPNRASGRLEAFWHLSSGGLTITHCTAMTVRRIAPGQGETIFLAAFAESSGGQVFRSVDYGARWERVREGLPEPAPRFTALCYDRRDPYVIFAGTEDGRLYHCREAGDSWYPLLSGLSPIRALIAV